MNDIVRKPDKRYFVTVETADDSPGLPESVIRDAFYKYENTAGFKKQYLQMVLDMNFSKFMEFPVIIFESESTLRARLKNFPEIETLSDMLQLGGALEYVRMIVSQDNCMDKICPPVPFFNKGEIALEIFESTATTDLEGNSCEPEKNKILPHDEKRITAIRSGSSVEYRANIDGYLVLTGGVLTICEPVRISEDRTEAAAFFIPQRGDETLLINSVYAWYNNFILENPVAPALEIPHRNDLSLPGKMVYKLLLVSGEKPVYGKNSRIEMIAGKDCFETDSSERLDYREIKNYIIVEKGELLFKKYPRVRGKRGVDIYGNPIDVPEGSDFKLIINENIAREDTDEGIMLFKASTGGIFNFENNRASVEEIMVVDSKIDYRTGNIYYSKPVQIRGDVSGGFTVSSEKDIIVEGSVEDGATVISKGNLHVFGGIVGSRTRVEVSGSITAGHVMDAKLFCSGNTLIRKTVIGGIIFSKKSLIVQGLSVKSADKSALFGGSYYSMHKIKAHSAGNENRQTLLCCGYNPFAEKSIEELKEAAGAIDLAISHTMAKLGGKINRPDFKNMIAGMGAQEKKETKKKLLKLKELSSKKSALEIRKKYLLNNIYSSPEDKPSIVVDKYIIPDVQLQIMDGKTVIKRRTRSLFIDNV